jgi:hypothetical protein
MSWLLQLLERLGVIVKWWIIATALFITFVFWLLLNGIWPEFRLDSGESLALFVIIFLILFLCVKIVDVVKSWIQRGSGS